MACRGSRRRRLPGGCCNNPERPRSSEDVIWSQHHIIDASVGSRGASAAAQEGVHLQGHPRRAAPIPRWASCQKLLLEVPCGSQRQCRVRPVSGGMPQQGMQRSLSQPFRVVV